MPVPRGMQQAGERVVTHCLRSHGSSLRVRYMAGKVTNSGVITTLMCRARHRPRAMRRRRRRKPPLSLSARSSEAATVLAQSGRVRRPARLL